MTTPRDDATALLAEALHAARIGCSPFTGTVMVSPSGASPLDRVAIPPCGPAYHVHDVEHLRDASPTLAADLEFAAAWRRVERALPEVRTWRIELSRMAFPDGEEHRWLAGLRYMGEEEGRGAWGDTPTAALTRLAEALEAMR